MAHSRVQFPWQLFRTLWKEGVANAFVPKSFGGIGLSVQNTHEVAHYMRAQPKDMKAIMEAHFSAQIALSVAETQKQEKFYPVMTQFPVVAAAPTIGNIPTASYSMTGEKYVINGNHVPYRNADVGSFYLIEAKKNDDPDHSTMFMIDKHEPGIYLEPKSNNNSGDENQRLVSFYNVTLTKDNVICTEGDGHNIRNMVAVIIEEIMNSEPSKHQPEQKKYTYSLFA